MKAIAHEHGITLTPESRLEADMLNKWEKMKANTGCCMHAVPYDRAKFPFDSGGKAIVELHVTFSHPTCPH